MTKENVTLKEQAANVGARVQEFAEQFDGAEATSEFRTEINSEIRSFLSAIRKEDRSREESITKGSIGKRDKKDRVRLADQDAVTLARTFSEMATDFVEEFSDEIGSHEDWSLLVHAVRDFKRFVRMTDRGRSEGILPARKPRKKSAETTENEPAPEVETDTVVIELTADTPSGSPDVVEEIREGLAKIGMELDPAAAELIQQLEDNDGVRLSGMAD